MTLSLRLFPI